MKKKTTNLIFLLLIMGAFVLFANSCKKDDIPVLTTTAISDITANTAKSGGNITSDAGAEVTARGVCWSTHETPTISDYKTTDGFGLGSFVSTISGLSANTTYYVRAYATNKDGTGYGNTLSFTSANTFKDPRDGNVYKKVTIGNQTWMAENLRYLPSVAEFATGSQTTPYYYVYDYNGTVVANAKATPNYTTYGVLYNWPAAMNGALSSTANPSGVQGICPDGWHLPSNAEWTELIDYLGGTTNAGCKLKATRLWNSPNTCATNESGFSALPGGTRNQTGRFYGIGSMGDWWSASEFSNDIAAWDMGLNYYYTNVTLDASVKETGWSVRCIKD